MECCKSMTFKVPGDDYIVKYYKARGCTVKDTEKGILISVPIECPELTAFGCRIYPDRPQLCRVMNGRLDPMTRDKCLWSEEAADE